MNPRFASPLFLRNVLLADAASCLGCGLLQVAWPGTVTAVLGLPATLLTPTGIFLLLYGALVGWLATRRPVPRAPVWLLAFGNIGWGLACVALLVAGGLQPTALGTAYVVLQAVTVWLLAELQLLALWQGAARVATTSP